MFCIVFFVWNAILMFVSLNSLVVFLVSLRGQRGGNPTVVNLSFVDLGVLNS
jgi:hypothetical protein